MQSQALIFAENDVRQRGFRRKREFTPEEQKDNIYWEKRRKNNEAAKKSREKRRRNDYVLESYVMALQEDNARLKAELMAMKIHFGLAHSAAYTAFQLAYEHDQARNSPHFLTPRFALDTWRSQESPSWLCSQAFHPVLRPIPQTRSQHEGRLAPTRSYLGMVKQNHLRRDPGREVWEEAEQHVPGV
ncbi:unnamed protein product [Knipowitschia caucasica]|uniref:BZIP domain-containing protein n=1 Tax=Knipowitschia caucasica TaxID=637954 RepID=A0AAV2L0G2_KNICA